MARQHEEMVPLSKVKDICYEMLMDFYYEGVPEKDLPDNDVADEKHARKRKHRKAHRGARRRATYFKKKQLLRLAKVAEQSYSSREEAGMHRYSNEPAGSHSKKRPPMHTQRANAVIKRAEKLKK